MLSVISKQNNQLQGNNLFISSNKLKTVILSLGSNISDRKNYLILAVRSLINSGQLFNHRFSSIYETDPVDYLNQSKFLNMAISAGTDLEPFELLNLCHSIEVNLGRKKRAKWHEREIDIDIIFYDGEIIHSKDLVIPHQRMHLRRFVLEPINEIAPDFIHPIFNMSIEDLLKKCPDESQVLFFDKLNFDN